MRKPVSFITFPGLILIEGNTISPEVPSYRTVEGAIAADPEAKRVYAVADDRDLAIKGHTRQRVVSVLKRKAD